jgi:hypothetical protein
MGIELITLGTSAIGKENAFRDPRIDCLATGGFVFPQPGSDGHALS